jgi:Skp family chaperone for outer membrane proteins
MSITAATPGASASAPAQTATSTTGAPVQTLNTGINGAPGASDTNEAASLGGGAEEDLELSLDELTGSQYDDHPELKGGHKGLPDYKKILEHLPENGRKLLGNLRASYTTKTQELADARRELEAERAQLVRDRQLMTESEWAQSVRAQAAAPLQHDAWSDEGLQERINKQAAEMMQKMLTPLQQDLEAQRRQVSLDSFKAQHPDLVSDDIRMPVARMLMERPELKLEDAYFIVKGQVSRQQTDAAKQIQRETLKKTSTGTAVRNGEPPKFKDAWTAYQYHKANGGR